MAVNAFRGQVGNAQVYDTALVRISEAFRKAEDDQGVIIPDAIRLFLRSGLRVDDAARQLRNRMRYKGRMAEGSRRPRPSVPWCS